MILCGLGQQSSETSAIEDPEKKIDLSLKQKIYIRQRKNKEDREARK